MEGYIDLRISGENDPKGVIEVAAELGWDAICLTYRISQKSKIDDLEKNIKKNKKIGNQIGINVLSGALLEPRNPASIQNSARSLRRTVDVIYVLGDGSVNRKASECWEIDSIATPELNSTIDFMKQKNSGIDETIARFCSERGIAIEVSLSSILNCHGKQRSDRIGRIRQNITLAKKMGVPLIMTSGATDRWDLRSPGDMECIGRVLGMAPAESRSAITHNPMDIIKKSLRRNDPNVIMKGLTVLDWGTIEPKKPKKVYGWY